MIIPAETIKLKDMKEYLLRSTEESDAEQLAYADDGLGAFKVEQHPAEQHHYKGVDAV